VLGIAASVLLLVAGAVLLAAGAGALVEHLCRASTRLGVRALALGLLATAADPREAVTALVAATQGHPALAAGDAVGANLVILTAALGLAGATLRLPVSRRVAEYAAAAAAGGGLVVLFLWNGLLSRPEGLALLGLYALGVAWVWRREREPPAIGELAALGAPRSGARGRLDPMLVALLGFVAMLAGGLMAVRGAVGMVGLLGLRESVVGLTVLAVATSAETVALVVAARRRALDEVAVAAAVGSVAYNATVSLGLAAIAQPLAIGRGSPITTVAAVTAVLPLVLLLGRLSGSLPRPVGAVLLAGYALTVGWLFTR
jgi:cation:H+ antiporter